MEDVTASYKWFGKREHVGLSTQIQFFAGANFVSKPVPCAASSKICNYASNPVADPGESPLLLFLDQTEARRAEKNWGQRLSLSPLSKGLDDRPPLSQGPDPALQPSVFLNKCWWWWQKISQKSKLFFLLLRIGHQCRINVFEFLW